MPGRGGLLLYTFTSSYKRNGKIVSGKNNYSILQIDYLSLTSSGGFNTEKVLRRCGTCSTFSNSRCTRRRTSPLEITSSEHRDGSFFPLIFETKSNSSLERLDSTLHPVKGHSLSTYSLLFQTCNHFQKF